MPSTYVERKIFGFGIEKIVADHAAGGGSVLLVGPPGSGKSSAVLRAFGQSIVWIQVSADLYPDDLLLKHLPLGDSNIRTVNGVLLDACLAGKPVFFDELNSARPSSLTPLYGPMEERRLVVQNCVDVDAMLKQVEATRPTGCSAADDLVEVHGSTVSFNVRPGFAVIAAVNPDQFDKPGLGLPDALIDRFLILPVDLTKDFLENVGVAASGIKLWAWTRETGFGWEPSLRVLLAFTEFLDSHSAHFAAGVLIEHVPTHSRAEVIEALSLVLDLDCAGLSIDERHSYRAR